MVWTIPKKISLAAQAGHLVKVFPGSKVAIKRNELCWIGALLPSELSQQYRARVRYKLGARPAVDLIDPKLERRDGKLPPHLYPNEELCLYMPGMNEWNGQMLVAETIIPWAAEWLFFYELWLATGVWHGGGAHPDNDLKPIRYDDA